MTEDTPLTMEITFHDRAAIQLTAGSDAAKLTRLDDDGATCSQSIPLKGPITEEHFAAIRAHGEAAESACARMEPPPIASTDILDTPEIKISRHCVVRPCRDKPGIEYYTTVIVVGKERHGFGV